MADDQPPRRPSDQPSGADAGWTALSYLIAGIGFWAFVGWLADRWLGIPNHFGLLVGMLVGAAGAVYLVIKRLGA
ncbi:MAG TPA: AtpZ/AtpI family protein [Micromonosporaceae bacterium]|nr:AtpZ/AtpI family protein [Micromonosporaceae bacterium]